VPAYLCLHIALAALYNAAHIALTYRLILLETSMIRFFLLAASLAGFLAVALGAFGAHALKARLSPDLLAVWHTAVQYQFYHVLALLAVVLLMTNGALESTALKIAGIAFVIGMVVFSGSLYVLCLSGVRWLGAITPLGGAAFLVGWVALFVFAWQWSLTR